MVGRFGKNRITKWELRSWKYEFGIMNYEKRLSIPIAYDFNYQALSKEEQGDLLLFFAQSVANTKSDKFFIDTIPKSV